VVLIVVVVRSYSVPRVSEALIDRVTGLGFPAIGRSSLGRPLPARRLGGDPEQAALVVVGGVHGDEPASTEAVLELAAWLADHPPPTPLWLIPALNPDGLAAGTKNSASDVDLNRNFPAANFTTSHPPGYHPGPRPLSEPETAALASLLDGEPVAGVIAVHAPFACVNYDGPARAWAAAVAGACGWPVRENIGYPTPGSLGSWLGRDRGWPVLTLELPAGPYDEFRAPAQNALQTAINLERIR
jgi:protein MpaA